MVGFDCEIVLVAWRLELIFYRPSVGEFSRIESLCSTFRTVTPPHSQQTTRTSHVSFKTALERVQRTIYQHRKYIVCTYGLHCMRQPLPARRGDLIGFSFTLGPQRGAQTRDWLTIHSEQRTVDHVSHAATRSNLVRRGPA